MTRTIAAFLLLALPSIASAEETLYMRMKDIRQVCNDVYSAEPRLQEQVTATMLYLDGFTYKDDDWVEIPGWWLGERTLDSAVAFYSRSHAERNRLRASEVWRHIVFYWQCEWSVETASVFFNGLWDVDYEIYRYVRKSLQ